MSETERFLQLIDPAAETFCFIAIAESGKSKAVFQRYGVFDALSAELTGANQVGFGISVAVNETDGKGRTADNIRRVRAVWHDDDVGWKGVFPLAPSMVVQTSPDRFHRYWLVEGDWPADEDGRSDFSAVMVGMVANHGSDPNPIDICRALRVPGFHHVKSEPHLVMIIGGDGQRYTRDEIVEAFAVVPKPRTVKPEQGEQDVDWVRVLDAMKVIPSDDRETWIKVGMALHHGYDGMDEGLEVWSGWSSASQKYDAGEQQRQWDSFRDKRDPVTVASIFHLAKEHGWEEKPTVQPLTPRPERWLRDHRWKNDLVNRTLVALRERFRDIGHHPHLRQLGALSQITTVIQYMAEGIPELEQDFWLSFVPPGVGKTTTVTEAIRILTKMEEYRDVGVIIFLSRVEEIAKLAKAMDLADRDFSVIVSDSYKEGGLGNPRKTEARVLFTTQQMLASRVQQHRCFVKIGDFHWNGQPRQVRIWDEAILPAQFVTIDQHTIAGLLKQAGRQGPPELTTDLGELYDLLGGQKDRTIIEVPDVRRHGVSLSRMRSWYDSDDERNACEALFKMSGKPVRVRKDLANAALDYEDIFPDDLGPLLVLDASGQQRKVYEFWHRDRKGLSFLRSARKDYSGLTIHHWRRGAGQKARKEDGETIADGIAKTIAGIPAKEPILVVHFKQKKKNDLDWASAIRSRLGRGNVSFCTWGRHTATNEFQDCCHVILVGVLQYSASQHEAIARGAKRLSFGDELSDSDFEETRLGEIAHNIFQAACRGMVRKSVGESCPPGSHLYAIFSTQKGTGIPQALLSRLFPGAAVKDWRPVIEPSGRAKELLGHLTGIPPGNAITKAELMERMGFNHPSQLSKLLKHRDIEGVLEAEGRRLKIDHKAVATELAPKLLPF